MPIPPRGNPSRPVALAANAARVLGVVCLLLGGLVACVTFTLFPAAPGATSAPAAWLFMLVGAGFFIVPGICYFIFANAMTRYRMWGAICCLVFAGLQGLLLLLSMLGSVMRGGGTGTSLVFFTFVLAVCVLLIVYTAQAIPVIRRGFVYRPTGFDPILANAAPTPMPVVPPPNPFGPDGYPRETPPPAPPPPAR